MHKRWPLHPYPYLHESLLSWISRIAMQYDTYPRHFLKYACNLTIVEDELYLLDLNPTRSLLHTLSERTGIESHRLQALTAQVYLPLLIDFSDLTTNFNLKKQYSILFDQTIHVHQNFRNSWFSYLRFSSIRGCQKCLTEDTFPYFRLHWRFPWMMSCHIHKILLQKVHFNIWPGVKNFYFSFSETGPYSFGSSVLEPASDSLCFMDSLTYQAVTTSTVDLPKEKIHGSVWLQILLTLIEELNPIGKMNKSAYHFITPFLQGLETYEMHGDGKPFECYHPKTQLALMSIAASVLQLIFSNQINCSSTTIKRLVPSLLYENDLHETDAQASLQEQLEKNPNLFITKTSNVLKIKVIDSLNITKVNPTFKGYTRISRIEGQPVLDSQRTALIAFGVGLHNIYEDQGAKLDARPGLRVCLQALDDGDTLVVWKLDRLGRSLKHLIEIICDLQNRNIRLKVLTGQEANVDISAPNAHSIFAALTEYESASKRMRAMGEWRIKMTPEKLRLAREAIGKPETKKGKLCKELGITPSTLCRYIDTSTGELRLSAHKLLKKGETLTKDL